MTPTILEPGAVTLDTLRGLMPGGRVALPAGAAAAIAQSAASVAAIAADSVAVYGVNTGFGKLARVQIAPGDLAELQRRLIVSHCVGVGDPLPDPIVRLILAIKINSLARGHSGVRREVIDALIALFNADVLPIVPAKGSVGASGDLAPLAHLSAALIGAGRFRRNGVEIGNDEAFARAGIAPVVLGPKEGLALINGSQVSTALALAGLFAAEDVFAAAIAAGALSVDAAAGSDAPFIPEIQAVRGHPGQIAVAATLAKLLEGSAIRASHVTGDDRVQDPYSLRCQPQVMGAVHDLLGYATQTLEREANAVSDNPLVFGPRVVSGGNFHAEPVAFAADMIAMALAEIGSLSERRTALLVDPALSGLPAFLVAEPGLNSGFMIAQVTAAALVCENKLLAHPASVDSLPTSANQEDHVSMATHGARRTVEMARNVADVVAIELLAAAQGVEMRRPLATAPALLRIHGMIRERSAFLSQDRALSADIARVRDLIEVGWFRGNIPLHFASSRESGGR